MSKINQEQPSLLAEGPDIGGPHSMTELGYSIPDQSFTERRIRTRNSMLWAAYADALGFISELVTKKGLEHRTNGAVLDQLMSWERRVGGRQGILVKLPAGCWSDDTQLRLSVSRAISNHGFDVECFARIELPVWPSYALGGGRASKKAARNLGKPGKLWYANSFSGWFNAGGNGAAMRIQPHVWSSPDLNGEYMSDVIIDSVCTHGHPRAIVGACFHAAALAHCLRTGDIPNLKDCGQIVDEIQDGFTMIDDHSSLGTTWKNLWEQETGQKLHEGWHATIAELREALDRAMYSEPGVVDITATYRGIIERLGLKAKYQLGSGILTSVAAVALAAISPSSSKGTIIAANEIGTDTDTIATMAGALLGACNTNEPPPQEPHDNAYLLAEADRLAAISQDHEVINHPYPDPLTWTAPRTQADALTQDNGQLIAEGLGPVDILEEAIWARDNKFAWQWVKTDFGQTLLIKRRPELKPLSKGNSLVVPQQAASPSPEVISSHDKASIKRRARLDSGVDIDSAVNWTRAHIGDDAVIGFAVREVARRGTLADLSVFLTEIRKDLRR